MAVIQIASVGDVNDEMMQMIARHIEAMFGLHTEAQNLVSLPNPDYAFDKKRGQYSSTLILRSIAPLATHCEKFLTITEVDLFIPMMTFVYGQAQLAGKVAVVSLARLRPEFYGLPPDKDLMVRRVRKEVSHELGHTLGLIHCPDKTCLMSLATEIMQVDLKFENFCRNCSLNLEENLKKLSIINDQRSPKSSHSPTADG